VITFHGKKVAKGKTVRRIVTKQFSAKYKKQLEAYRKGLRTTTDANRKEKLRRRIIRVRVIKGGMDYIRNCQNRLKRYEKIFKKKKTPAVKNRMVVLRKRIIMCKRFYRSKKIQKIRRNITKRRVVKKNAIKITKNVVNKRVRRK
jgi:hypothetical protein